MEVTYKQIATFRTIARNYLAESGSKQNKLTYALQKMIAKTEKEHNYFSEKENDIRQENALVKDDGFKVNERGVIEVDPKKAKEYNKSMKELSDKTVEIEPHIATQLPQEFNLSLYEYFIPFVIADYPEPVEEEEEVSKESK